LPPISHNVHLITCPDLTFLRAVLYAFSDVCANHIALTFVLLPYVVTTPWPSCSVVIPVLPCLKLVPACRLPMWVLFCTCVDINAKRLSNSTAASRTVSPTATSRTASRTAPRHPVSFIKCTYKGTYTQICVLLRFAAICCDLLRLCFIAKKYDRQSHQYAG
jgi:hypothetical protein